MGPGPRARLPLDFAPILSVAHIPLLQESPLMELLEALKHHRKSEPVTEKEFQRLVSRGLESSAIHFASDHQQLHRFNEDWENGRYFVTKRAAQKAASRTSLMWFEADKYLEVSSELRHAKFNVAEEGLANESPTDALAESTMDLATRVLGDLKKEIEP